MAFDIHSMLLLVFGTSMDLDLFYYLHVQHRHVPLMSILCFSVVEVSVGFQQVKLGERGGRRRDFNDTGVNTRQFIEHVKESKSGLLKSNFLHIIPCML